MILFILSRILTFLSNVAINKGNKLLFHRYDVLSLVLFFIGVVFWFDPNLRQYFNLLQINVPWSVTIGFGLIALPVVLTFFHAVIDGKKKGTIWYFGDGYGNIFEDIIRTLSGSDYNNNKKRYIITSLIVRALLFAGGAVISIPYIIRLF